MSDADRIKSDISNQKDLLRCPECDIYLKRTEGFRCPKCKRAPLCKSHRTPGKRECTRCAIDIKVDELNKLRREEVSIKNFIKFLHFIFLVYLCFFISIKMGLADMIDFLQNNILIDNLIFLSGGIILGYLIMYIILYNQRNIIKKLKSELENIKIRRQF